MTKLVIELLDEIKKHSVVADERKLFNSLEMVLDNYNMTPKGTALALPTDIPDHAKIYFSCKKLEGMSPSTAKNYLYVLRHFAKTVIKPVAKITLMDIRRYICLFPDHKASTMQTKIYCLRSFFGWLRDKEYIVKDPTHGIEMPKVPGRIRKSLSVEALEQARNGCLDARDRALVEVYLSTGCRVSELVGKCFSEIHDGAMSVIGKGNKERLVYFNEKAMMYLKIYMSSRTYASDIMFTADRVYHAAGVVQLSRAICKDAIAKIIKGIGIRAGLHLHPHIFRHTFAKFALDNGAPLTTVQQFLGHSDPKTTQIYAMASESTLRAEHRRCCVA